jgi:hypothetical protein
MKKLRSTFSVIFYACLILTSCEGGNQNKNEETNSADTLKVRQDNEETRKDSLNIIKNGENESIKTVQGNVNCKLFFQGFDFIDEETGESSPGNVSEREEFKTKKTYTFCYDSESFHHLTLIGTGEKLSFFIIKGNRQVYKKENIDLKNNVTFTNKEFKFNMGETYSILVKQNDNIIYNGKIDSQGCM